MDDQTSSACAPEGPQFERRLDLVVVLGMPRSGTSAITRGLQTLGVELGENLMPPDTITNVKGFWEDLDIYQLNLELLSHLGLDWHSLSPINEIHVDLLCDSGYLAKAVTLLRSKLLRDRPFGLKDPRIAKLILFWQRVFEHCKLKVGYVVSLRNPISVAQSLMRRDGFDFEKSYLLWLDYMLNSLVHTENQIKVVVDFDLVLKNPLEQFERIAGFLNLSLNSQSLNEFASGFLDSSLCHSTHRPEDLKIDSRIIGLVVEIHSVAKDLSLIEIGSDASSGHILRLRSNFKDILPLFHYVEKLNGVLAERNGDLVDLRHAVTEWDERLATLNQTVTGRDGQLVTLKQTVAERDGQLITLQHTVAERDGQLIALQHTIAERDGQLISLKQSLAGQDRHLLNLQHALTKCDELKIEAEASRSEADIALDKEKRHRAVEALAREQLVIHTLKYSVKSRLVAMLPLLFLRRAKTRREVRHMKRVKAFDRNFYESQLPSGFKIHQPVVHYVVIGRKLGLKSHPEPLPKIKDKIDLKSKITKQAIRVIFFSGEPHTPGHSYRVAMYAEAASSNGCEVRIIGPSDILNAITEVAGVDVLVIWRAAWNDNIATMVDTARSAGARIVFDLDDLMFDPSLAKCELVDGIRSQGLNELDIAEFYGRIGKTMRAADFCTCSTQPLATAMRLFHKSTMVLPNGFDKERYQRSRRAIEARRTENTDGKIRIGYAGGSKTHQKDFAQAVPAVARILHENPKCLLVLFRAANQTGHVPYIAMEEFPQLHGLEDQIEWRDIVPVQQLPDELARFDINLAPLETGNPYCEAKSELKYFEAALVAVPTVASPTGPYADAIRHEETGFLASSENEWYQALSRLVSEPDFRKKMADLAFMDVLWRYGPERRAELGRVLFDQILGSSQDAATSFSLELRRKHVAMPSSVQASEYNIIVEFGKRGGSDVAVIVPLYNYAEFIVEALDSVAVQTLHSKDLIVIDDCSTDNSLMVAREWIEQNHRHFGSIALLKNCVNSGLALTRNAGFAFSDAPYVMPLDADNMLEPKCLARLLKQITETGAATAYPTIQMFGNSTGTLGSDIWQPVRFAGGNYIDAMALIRKSAWAAVGGYRPMQVMGWEDFEFWCNFVENGLWGVWVPDAQAFYRVHGTSMIQGVQHSQDRRHQIVQEISAKHPWLDRLCLSKRW